MHLVTNRFAHVNNLRLTTASALKTAKARLLSVFLRPFAHIKDTYTPKIDDSLRSI